MLFLPSLEFALQQPLCWLMYELPLPVTQIEEILRERKDMWTLWVCLLTEEGRGRSQIQIQYGFVFFNYTVQISSDYPRWDGAEIMN
jgi:hypothetical protein